MSLFPFLSQFKHKGRIVTTETKFQSRKLDTDKTKAQEDSVKKEKGESTNADR